MSTYHMSLKLCYIVCMILKGYSPIRLNLIQYMLTTTSYSQDIIFDSIEQ